MAGPDFDLESVTGGSGAHQARHMKLALLFNRSNRPMAFPGMLILDFCEKLKAKGAQGGRRGNLGRTSLWWTRVKAGVQLRVGKNS